MSQAKAEQLPCAISEKIELPKQGSFLRRLQNYAILGWVLFIFTLFIFLVYVLIVQLMPPPIMAVDEHGRVLGIFEYMSPQSRDDTELIGAGVYFLDNYLSLNASTVLYDSANWLEMTCEALHKDKVQELRDTNYIAEIQNTGIRTKVYFDEHIETKPRLIRHLNGRIQGIYHGSVRFVDSNKVVKNFKISLDFNIVPRSRLATRGVEVCQIEDL